MISNICFFVVFVLFLKRCQICTNDCLECLNPSSYCRQCKYPMSLDTITYRCLPCCTTNITTNDCCQCTLSWDGKNYSRIFLSKKIFRLIDFCLHLLVTPLTKPSTNWFIYSIEKVRNLNYS